LSRNIGMRPCLLSRILEGMNPLALLGRRLGGSAW
jgi:hypothetical protein